MTFHAGNGVKLSKEQENLPEEERKELIESMQPVDYENPEVQEDLDSRDRIRKSVDLVNRLDAEQPIGKTSAPASATKKAEEIPQGAYGVRKNQDFSAYRQKRAAEREAARKAERARISAENAKRQELLASGRYYDDGRGNLRLKKEFRQYVSGIGRGAHLRTAPDGGSGNLAVQNAGATSWAEAAQGLRQQEEAKAGLYAQSAIAANRQAMAEEERQKAERVKNGAKGKLSVFDGFAAALDAMTNATAQEEMRWGGKDEQGRDGRWTYDEQGRITGQAEKRGTGFSVKRGFVSRALLKGINDRLNQRGVDYNITGIMATQRLGAIGKPNEGEEPSFYVQGIRNDGTRFGQMMSLKDVYRWGVDSFTESGGAGDAREFAINALGGYDPDGYMKSTEYLEKKAKIDKIRADADGTSSSALTFDQRLQLEDRKDKRQEAAIAAREKSESGKHEIQLRQMFNRRKKSAEDNLAKYEKELRGAKKKIGKLEEQMYSDEEIQQKLDERANSLVASIREDFGEFADLFASEASSSSSQAVTKKVDNTKSEGDTTYKEGDEQVIGGVQYVLKPSKKNPNKLTWQRKP